MFKTVSMSAACCPEFQLPGRAFSLCLLIAVSSAVLPSGANPPAAAPAKPAPSAAVESKGNAAPEAKAPAIKKSASFLDPQVGAKTTGELVKKLEEAYKNQDSPAYISVLHAPMRTRIRMQLQFNKENKSLVNNFRFVTVKEEAARLKLSVDEVIKPRLVAGFEKGYELPVVGFVVYDYHFNPKAHPDVIGVAVGKGKDGFYIQPLQDMPGSMAKAVAAQSVPSASSKSASAAGPMPVKAR